MEIKEYIEKIDKIQSKVKEDSELILGEIDIDTLLDNPEGYLTALGMAFLNDHEEEFSKGYELGDKFART